jgi:hypothetical protein
MDPVELCWLKMKTPPGSLNMGTECERHFSTNRLSVQREQSRASTSQGVASPVKHERLFPMATHHMGCILRPQNKVSGHQEDAIGTGNGPVATDEIDACRSAQRMGAKELQLDAVSQVKYAPFRVSSAEPAGR